MAGERVSGEGEFLRGINHHKVAFWKWLICRDSREVLVRAASPCEHPLAKPEHGGPTGGSRGAHVWRSLSGRWAWWSRSSPCWRHQPLTSSPPWRCTTREPRCASSWPGRVTPREMSPLCLPRVGAPAPQSHSLLRFPKNLAQNFPCDASHNKAGHHRAEHGGCGGRRAGREEGVGGTGGWKGSREAGGGRRGREGQQAGKAGRAAGGPRGGQICARPPRRGAPAWLASRCCKRPTLLFQT